MSDWFPKRGEMVFSTPIDVPLNHLTRLEEVVELGKNIVTASGRCFRSWDDFRSIDDTSLEYGVLELRQVTPERMAEFNRLRLLETTEASLRSMDWEKFVSELDPGGMVILQAAVWSQEFQRSRKIFHSFSRWRTPSRSLSASRSTHNCT